MRFPRISGRQILISVAAVIIFYMLADFNNRLAELQRVSAERDRAAAQATRLMETQVMLETEIAYATSDAAAEERAYEDLRQARQGDVLVVPIPAEGQLPTPTPPPETIAEPVENWELWWSLFFDDVQSP